MKDVFLIDLPQERTLIYSPLKGAVFTTNKVGRELVEKYLQGEELSENDKSMTIWNYMEKIDLAEDKAIVEEDKITVSGAVILLSQVCNLACTYCYSGESRSKDTVSFDKLKTGIDYVFENATTNELKFTFIGGGEPLITWELFRKTVDYIKLQNETRNFKINYNIATNGTLIDAEKAIYFKENGINISLSFEILPDIQNKQRPFYKENKNSFEEVDKSIKILAESGIYPRLRSTITSENVSRMEEMVNFTIERYQELGHLHFEHVADNKNDSNKEFYDKFIENYFKAKSVADKHKIELKNSIVNSVSRVSNSFCNGELVFTPTSDITRCHRFSSKKDFDYDKFLIGKIEDDNLIMFGQSFSNAQYVKCHDCFAKYNCAGGCPAVLNGMSEKQKEEYCSFTKGLIIRTLLDKINMSKKNGGAEK